MSELLITAENSLLCIPFYTDPTAPEYNHKVEKFAQFAAGAKEVTGLKLAIIDDGSQLDHSQFEEVTDHLISFPNNLGKSSAFRNALKDILADPLIKSDFIVQYDGDGDQSYIDIPVIHDKLVDISEGNPEIPTLVIGDRYSEKLTVEPNPQSIEYRQTILTFFGALALQLTGAEGVRDWVSGARGMTASMARELVHRGQSNHYGLESEQLIIAGSINARVATAPLTISRPRDPNTLRTKWLQNFEVYTSHAQDLIEQGKGHIVNLIGKLVTNLTAEVPEFELDLEPIGENTIIKFIKQDDSYTARIPWEHRSKIFVNNASFLTSGSLVSAGS